MLKLQHHIAGSLSNRCRHQLLHQQVLRLILSVAHGHRCELINIVSAQTALLVLVSQADII